MRSHFFLTCGRSRPPPEGLSENDDAFYPALVQNESGVCEMKDGVPPGLAQELMAKLRKSATMDWQKRDRDRMGTLVKHCRYPSDN